MMMKLTIPILQALWSLLCVRQQGPDGQTMGHRVSPASQDNGWTPLRCWCESYKPPVSFVNIVSSSYPIQVLILSLLRLGYMGNVCCSQIKQSRIDNFCGYFSQVCLCDKENKSNLLMTFHICHFFLMTYLGSICRFLWLHCSQVQIQLFVLVINTAFMKAYLHVLFLLLF